MKSFFSVLFFNQHATFLDFNSHNYAEGDVADVIEVPTFSFNSRGLTKEKMHELFGNYSSVYAQSLIFIRNCENYHNYKNCF